MIYTKEGIESELIGLLKDFDIPDNRRVLNQFNYKWMIRNLGIKNSNHIKFDKVIYLVKFLINMK